MKKNQSWLGFDRYHRDRFSHERDLGLGGVLTGVRKIDWSRLARARNLLTFKMGEGQYLVVEPSVIEAWPHKDVSLFEWLNRPVFRQRGGEEDLDGWNSYWVNLSDPYVDPCYCRDMYIHEDAGIPCKHLLAALIADEHPFILKKLRELEKRDRIARILKDENTEVA